LFLYFDGEWKILEGVVLKELGRKFCSAKIWAFMRRRNVFLQDDNNKSICSFTGFVNRDPAVNLNLTPRLPVKLSPHPQISLGNAYLMGNI